MYSSLPFVKINILIKMFTTLKDLHVCFVFIYIRKLSASSTFIIQSAILVYSKKSSYKVRCTHTQMSRLAAHLAVNTDKSSFSSLQSSLCWEWSENLKTRFFMILLMEGNGIKMQRFNCFSWNLESIIYHTKPWRSKKRLFNLIILQ